MKKMTERRQGAVPPIEEPRSVTAVCDPVDGVLREAQACDPLRVTALDYCRFLAVATYLGFVFLLLAAMRKVSLGIAPRAVARWVRGRLFFRVRRPITLVPIGPERGHAYYAFVDGRILSDLESASRLQLYEDGVPLLPAHAVHDLIRDTGKGAFSHWGHVLYFSTSDNSDPRTNRRTYTIKGS
jgi:hypothetical protein